MYLFEGPLLKPAIMRLGLIELLSGRGFEKHRKVT